MPALSGRVVAVVFILLPSLSTACSFWLSSEGCLHPCQVHLYPASVRTDPVNLQTQETDKCFLFPHCSQHILRWSAAKQTAQTYRNHSDSEDSMDWNGQYMGFHWTIVDVINEVFNIYLLNKNVYAI